MTAKRLRFPPPTSQPPTIEPVISEIDADGQISISISALMPDLPDDPRLDVLVAKDDHTYHYRVFEQPGQPGDWTMTASVDGRPDRLNPLEDVDAAREMTWALRIQISEHIREGWHVVRDEGLAGEEEEESADGRG